MSSKPKPHSLRSFGTVAAQVDSVKKPPPSYRRGTPKTARYLSKIVRVFLQYYPDKIPRNRLLSHYEDGWLSSAVAELNKSVTVLALSVDMC